MEWRAAKAPYVLKAILKLTMTDSLADFTLDTPNNIRSLSLKIMDELEYKHRLSHQFADPEKNPLKERARKEALGELHQTYYTGRIDRVLRDYINSKKLGKEIVDYLDENNWTFSDVE